MTNILCATCNKTQISNFHRITYQTKLSLTLFSPLPLGFEWPFYSCSIFDHASKSTQPFHHALGLLDPWGFAPGQSAMCSLSDVSIHRFMPDLFTKGFHHRSKGSIKVSMTLNMIHGHWLVNTHQSFHVLHDHWTCSIHS